MLGIWIKYLSLKIEGQRSWEPYCLRRSGEFVLWRQWWRAKTSHWACHKFV